MEQVHEDIPGEACLFVMYTDGGFRPFVICC